MCAVNIGLTKPGFNVGSFLFLGKSLSETFLFPVWKRNLNKNMLIIYNHKKRMEGWPRD